MRILRYTEHKVSKLCLLYLICTLLKFYLIFVDLWISYALKLGFFCIPEAKNISKMALNHMATICIEGI